MEKQYAINLMNKKINEMEIEKTTFIEKRDWSDAIKISYYIKGLKYALDLTNQIEKREKES
jgi:hypothetical protein